MFTCYNSTGFKDFCQVIVDKMQKFLKRMVQILSIVMFAEYSHRVCYYTRSMMSGFTPEIGSGVMS